MTWAIPLRMTHLAAVLVRHGLAYAVGSAMRRLPWVRGSLAEPPEPPERFRALLERLGGTFIKFGQVLALQPDVLSEKYRDALFDLMDRVPPFAYEEVDRIFREDLGHSPGEIFESFEENPKASASIGQVHLATLGGRRLAVKVQRPTALADFGADVRIMRSVRSVIQWLQIDRLQWLVRAISDFVDWTSEELDYLTEARYMDRLSVNARGSKTERVPEVHWDLSTPRILTAEYLEGSTLLDYIRSLESGDQESIDRFLASGFDPEKLAHNILKNFLGDVFRHGVFHADLHPANLLILPDNAVGYVDFGITGVISRYARQHLGAMVLAATRGDLTELWRRLLKISDITEQSNVEGCRRGFQERRREWYREELGRIRVTKSYTMILLDTLRISQDNKVLPHQEAVRYMRSVITCEGLIARFAPGVDINEPLERYIAQLLESQILGSSLTAGNLIEWWKATGRLLRDGAPRLNRLLDRLESGGASSTEAERAHTQREETAAHRSRAIRLAVSISVLTLLLTIFREPMVLGFNIFTAEVLLIGSGLALFARTVVRWLTASG